MHDLKFLSPVLSAYWSQPAFVRFGNRWAEKTWDTCRGVSGEYSPGSELSTGAGSSTESFNSVVDWGTAFFSFYMQVSTTMQIDDYSLDVHKSRMKAYVYYNDFKIVGEYEGADKSGKSIESRV